MRVDVLAIGAHPDDVDMICGGTLAKLAARGRRVAILDLTRGEMGTRGTPELRAEEAMAAAEVLGVCQRTILDLGDGRLRDSEESRRQVIEILRALRPAIVMGHYWDDLHPDHCAAGRIVRSVIYPAGFSNYPAAGEPFRPNEALFFMAHTPFAPSFVVAIDEFHERKLEAVRCYKSQIHDPDSTAPQTGISQPDFLLRLEARARYFGAQIGRTHGEPFLVARAVPMEDPVAHYAAFAQTFPPSAADAPFESGCPPWAGD